MREKLSAIFIISGIAILLALGFWQLQRMGQKKALISDLENKSTLPIIKPHKIKEDYNYRIIELCGHFQKGKDLFVYHKPNYIILAPFISENSDKAILVARGILKLKDKKENSFLIKNTSQICISGMLIPSEKKPIFMPESDGSINKPLLSINANYAGEILGQTLYNKYVILTQNTDPILQTITKPKGIKIPNNHLEYALTWFILAGILLFMFVTSRKNLASKSSGKSKLN